jgi:hypothetical protein
MNEMERKLERSIRDLDDIRMVIETLKKIRENEVDMELKIEPIEEAFNVLTRYDLPVDREDLELVDNVRYCWQRVLSRAMDMNIYLLESQPQLQKELADNLKHFKLDCVQYCHEYRTLGPMMPGLTPREASDRLIMFQVNYKDISLIMCIYLNNFPKKLLIIFTESIRWHVASSTIISKRRRIVWFRNYRIPRARSNT